MPFQGNYADARAAFLADRPLLMARGISWHPGVEPHAYVPLGFESDMRMAMDAVPAIQSDPNSGIPVMLTTWIDPEVYRFLFAPLMAAEIIGDERRRGTWVDDTSLFPIVEATGETTTYGDFNDTGDSGFNADWPARQNYLFQSMIRYGDREIERMGVARINLVSEKQQAMARNLNTFLNFIYFFGVSGLQNYGLLNDPNLSAALTPAPKAYGGSAWVSASGQVVASANEIYTDIQSMYLQLVKQTAGVVQQDTDMCLALAPQSQAALTATNSFNVNVADLLKKNFPKLEVKAAVQYGAANAQNTQGQSSGLNYAQLIARQVDGLKTGFCAFAEKLRSFPVVRETSSYRQKNMSGAWGTVLRLPAGIASMAGI